MKRSEAPCVQGTAAPRHQAAELERAQRSPGAQGSPEAGSKAASEQDRLVLVFKVGVRVGAEKEKEKQTSYPTLSQQEAVSAARRPGKGPGLGSPWGVLRGRAGPGGAALGSGTQIAGRSRPRQPCGQLRTKRQQSGSDSIRLSHFFRASRASPAALAQAESRRGGTARPTRKNPLPPPGLPTPSLQRWRANCPLSTQPPPTAIFRRRRKHGAPSSPPNH